MGNQEEEYQCSECGTDVQANTKVCPNCGANLDETSEVKIDDEDEFVDFPITSHPADLASILSLLDENKIEYSVNNNAMESIWGPNFIQFPRLMVHKDQYENVKEIIDSFESEEIKIIDEKEYSGEADDLIDEQRNEKKENPLTGVEGWLLFFSLMLMLGPIGYLSYSINNYLNLKNEIYWFPIDDSIIYTDIILSTIISIISIYAGWSLWKIRPNALTITRFYLNSVLIYSIISFIGITIYFLALKISTSSIFQTIYGITIEETISSIIYVVVWKLYLKNSERVKNTYGSRFEIDIE
jgi:hypothetical protein